MSTAARRRQNSSAATGRARGLSLHMRNANNANNGNASSTPPVRIEPKSAHTSDPFLQAFLNPSFDAAEYLNSTLPPLQGSSSSTTTTSSSSLRSASSAPSSAPSAPAKVALADLSAEAQTLLTQLSAHTTRLTGTLTQLTEDILRSGSRLAYEVELLRGETLGLAEALADDGPLRADLDRFVPAGGLGQAAAAARARRASLVASTVPPTPAPGTGTGTTWAGAEVVASPVPATPAAPGATPVGGEGQAAAGGGGEDEQGGGQQQQQQPPQQEEPPYISHLRTLTLVRARLDAVIKTFGDAMEFVFPPSEISVSSGFLSVSAPDFPDRHQSSAERISTEDKGQQVLRGLREEIAGLLRGDGGGGAAASYEDRVRGVESATRRVEEIKTLCSVWRGTAEEKGRQRFVESLARMVEEKHRELVREVESQREKEAQQGRKDDAGARRDQAGSSDATTTESRGPLGGYGFMNQWQKIRGGL